jgi:hypothetical protein
MNSVFKLIQTSSADHPASYVMDTLIVFPSIKWSNREIDYSPLLVPRFRVNGFILYSHYRPSCRGQGKTTDHIYNNFLPLSSTSVPKPLSVVNMPFSRATDGDVK